MKIKKQLKKIKKLLRIIASNTEQKCVGRLNNELAFLIAAKKCKRLKC